MPIYNPAGKYIVRLTFNGASPPRGHTHTHTHTHVHIYISVTTLRALHLTSYTLHLTPYILGVPRKIVVDDRLPLSRGGELMCSHSTHREELWVSIIEKAYLKVLPT